MAKKRPKIDLTPTTPPRRNDLERLFAGDDDAEQSAGLQLLAIRLDAITPDPEQPRRTFDEESLAELSASIRQDGVIQPIELIQVGHRQYRIVHGERRWRAARLAGLETIPAVVRRQDYDELTRFVRQIVENIQREDLNDVDRAVGLLRLRELMQAELAERAAEDGKSAPWGRKVSWAKVGERLGYSRQRIHQLVKLLDLHEELQDAVRQGQLSERDTRPYQKLSPAQQVQLFQASREHQLSPADVRKVAERWEDAPETDVTEMIHAMQRPASRPTRAGGRAGKAEQLLTHLDRTEQLLTTLAAEGLSSRQRGTVVARLRTLRERLDELLEALDD